MTSTVFVDYSNATPITAAWLNDVNRLQYTILGNPATVADVTTALGLGNASTKTVGAVAGDIPLWDYTLLNSTSPQVASYTVLATDRGKLIDATTGTWVLTFNPTTAIGANPLGAGFAFAVRNSGTGVITLTPTSGTLDGAATVTLALGESCFVVCDGTNAKTVGKTSNARYKSSPQAITLGGLLTLAHGLGVRPESYGFEWYCATAEGGWSVGDVVIAGTVDSNYTGTGYNGMAVYADGTNIYVRFGSDKAIPALINKTTGAGFTPTTANWNLIVKARV